MFVLNPEQVRNKVFFYQGHEGAEENHKLVPYVLIRDGAGWDRVPVSELDRDGRGHPIITMKSKKSDKDFFWYLKEIIYLQLNGDIPEGYVVRQIEPNNYTPHNFVLRKFNVRNDQ
jgi:hypothetical protein